MLIVAPDFDRCIDLPGAGPAPRPVDIDQAKTGFDDLVSLRVYAFAKDMVIDGEAEADEVFIFLMRGHADIGVDQAGTRTGPFRLRADAEMRALYLPPHASYQLTAVTDCDVAYARVRPVASPLPAPDNFATHDGRVEIAAYATGMDLAFATFRSGEQYAIVGRDGSAGERFVHVRYEGDGVVTIAGERLEDWGSAALGHGESATLEVIKGMAEVLTISAAAH